FEPLGVMETRVALHGLEAFEDTAPEVFEIVSACSSFSADVPTAGFGVEFYGYQSGAILSSISLLLHEQSHFVEAVERGAIGFFIVGKWFQ
ncbi:MAG: hypothetical protein AB8F74_20985, partial [Saprospiraceae bacterium]